MELNEYSKGQILQCLKELSDIEHQKRVWIRGEGAEVSSYSELSCQLYDDTLLGDLLEKASVVPLFSKEIDSILNRLSITLDKIDGSLDAETIIQHPRWKQVLSLSEEAHRLIDQFLNPES